jgi:hypothetical protein
LLEQPAKPALLALQEQLEKLVQLEQPVLSAQLA